MKNVRGRSVYGLAVLAACSGWGLFAADAGAQGYYGGRGNYGVVSGAYRPTSNLFYNSSSNRSCYGGSSVRSGSYGGGAGYGVPFATRQPVGSQRYGRSHYQRNAGFGPQHYGNGGYGYGGYGNYPNRGHAHGPYPRVPR